MKKLLFVLAFTLVALSAGAQRFSEVDSIPGTLTGSDTTVTLEFNSVGFWSSGAWSVHFWYKSLDNTDGTLGVYGSNFVSDSANYVPLWIDQNLDGSNDNPKTLSDTTWLPWGEAGPFRYLILKYTKGSNTAGQIYYDARKQ